MKTVRYLFAILLLALGVLFVVEPPARAEGGPRACNAYGCWQQGGGCNAYGCWRNGGGCNAYGCWNTRFGSCNAYGCRDIGGCNAYGCWDTPRGGCNAYGCWR